MCSFEGRVLEGLRLVPCSLEVSCPAVGSCWRRVCLPHVSPGRPQPWTTDSQNHPARLLNSEGATSLVLAARLGIVSYAA